MHDLLQFAGTSLLPVDLVNSLESSHWLWRDCERFWCPIVFGGKDVRVLDLLNQDHDQDHGVFSGGLVWSPENFSKRRGIVGSMDCGTGAQARIATASFTLEEPFTVCSWFNCDDLTAENVIWAMGTDSTTMHRLSAAGDTAGDPIRAVSRDGGSASHNGPGYSANTWHHGAGVWAAANSRKAYLDGVSTAGTETSVKNPTLTNTILGNRHGAGAAFSGLLGPVWVYSRAFSEDEMLQHYLLTRHGLDKFLNRTSWLVSLRVAAGAPPIDYQHALRTSEPNPMRLPQTVLSY